MNWPDPSGKVGQHEFDSPSYMDPQLVACLGETRLWFGRRMNFSKPRHPHGDACAVGSGHHSNYSLHLYGIDHVESVLAGCVIRSEGALCLACDFSLHDIPNAYPSDSPTGTPPDPRLLRTTAEMLFDAYLRLERLNIWTGIGLYPLQYNPGFHVDLRPAGHPAYRYRWWRRGAGDYPELTWSAYKSAFL